MIFKKSSILGLNYLSNGIEALACIFYRFEKARSLSTETSRSSFLSEIPGLGGCDVTGRILRS